VRLCFIAAAVVLAAASPAAGGRAAFPGVPSIYVNYNPDCSFSMYVDGGTTITATAPPGPVLPPGAYQILVYMPNLPAGYDCVTPDFTLKGPGVSTATVFPNESLLDNHLLPAFQPSSTYVAEDETNPAGTRVFFTTSASGSSSSLVGPAPGTTTTTSKGSGQSDLVGSSVLPYRGRLTAAVTRFGATLAAAGKPVASLKAGRYDLTIRDFSSTSGFDLQRAGGKPVPLSADRYRGTKTRRVTLSRGKWTFGAGAGDAGTFVVS
jgi:hypothetical protein